MDTKEKLIELSDKIRNILDEKKGVLTLTFFDNTSVTVRLKEMNSHLSQEAYSCILTTFTNDINKTNNYDIKLIKDVN